MFLRALLVVFLSVSASAGWAQFQTVQTGKILVLDRSALLTQTVLGREILILERTESEALIETGNLLTLAFEAEERALTEQRDTLPAEEFGQLADDFNNKVEQARADQIENDEAQVTSAESRRRAFFTSTIPQLGELIQKYGASAIMDRRYVLLFDKNLDITLEAIALIDQAYANNPNMLELGN